MPSCRRKGYPKILKQQKQVHLPENMASNMWLGGRASQGYCGPEEGPSVRGDDPFFTGSKKMSFVFWMPSS